MSVIFFMCFWILFGSVSMADLKAEQISFIFLSNDGSIWEECRHSAGKEMHSWKVECGTYRFDLHMFLRSHPRAEETTYEFHYWATETARLHETHTQSTWLTVDGESKAKRILGYLGFAEDALQLRIQIQL